MKPFVILALWAFLGWDVGAWAEAYTGLPAVVGVVAGVTFGAWLAVEARRRLIARAQLADQKAAAVVALDSEQLERAA